MQSDSDDDDPSTFEFFKNPNALHRATAHSYATQQLSGDMPRWEKVSDVDPGLWFHITDLVITVIVKSTFAPIDDASEDDAGDQPMYIFPTRGGWP